MSYLLAKSAADDFEGGKEGILKTCGLLDQMLDDECLSNVESIAEKILEKEHAFVLGKGQNFNIALEGALKIKEISYKHFEGFAAGELKHGVIALIETGTPVFVIVSEDQNKSDLLSAAAEVKARGAMVIGVSSEPNELFDDVMQVPDAGECSPILNVVPFQLISYYLGTKLGHAPDKPRNLAKSVTVK